MAKRRPKSRPRTERPTPTRDFVAEFARLEPRYRQLAQRVDGLIVELLRLHHISVHATEYRSKTVDSFAEKIQRPGKRYDDPLSELSDLAGNRVILYYQEDVNAVCDILRSEFSVDDERRIDKAAELDADHFGYNSVHLVVGINDDRLALPEWNSFDGLVTEIQVRTVLQHAWAAVSHSLQYKRESDIPTTLRRRPNRLSGLFELADDEFSTIRTKRQEVVEHISHQLAEENLATEVNSLSVSQYLADSKVAQLIEMSAAKQDELDIEPDDDLATNTPSIAQLIHITTIQQLDERLQEVAPQSERFFEEFASEQGDTKCLGDRDHWCAVLLAAAAHNGISVPKLKQAVRWGEDYCEATLSSGSSVFG